MRLNPNATTATAIRRAVASYDEAAHLDPEYAAETFYRKAVAAKAERRSAEVRQTTRNAYGADSLMEA